MRSRSNSLSLVSIPACMALLATITAANAGDWPQYLGPTMNGVSAETGLARTWPKGGPKVLWTVSLGVGYGAPAVKNNLVYVLDRVDNKKDVLRCLDLAGGREQWTFEYAAPGKLSHDGSRTTPTVDDKHVYALGPFGHFHCVSLETRRPVWKKDLAADFNVTLPRWGFAQNPVLYKNTVITAPQGSLAGLVAFDRVSGKVVWKTPFVPQMAPGGWHGSYVTPVVLNVGGVDQVVLILAPTSKKDPNGNPDKPGLIMGYDAAGGSLLWTHAGWNCAIPIPCAMSPADDLVFVAGGYNAGVIMLKLARKNNLWSVSEVFKTTDSRSQLHPPIAYEDHLYIESNDKGVADGLMCLTLDGKIKWQTGKSDRKHPDFNWGGMLLADGMIYIVDGKKGDLRLVEPTPDGYKELAKVQKILGGKEIWAPPALSNGRLLIRDQSKMLCLDVRKR